MSTTLPALTLRGGGDGKEDGEPRRSGRSDDDDDVINKNKGKKNDRKKSQRRQRRRPRTGSGSGAASTTAAGGNDDSDRHESTAPNGNEDDAGDSGTTEGKRRSKSNTRRNKRAGSTGTAARNDNQKGSGEARETGDGNRSEEQRRSPSEAMVEEILMEEDYYRILGLNREEVSASSASSSSAASALITKAYRRRCVLTHPDKTGGDRRAFDKVAEAYEVLSDDEKRNIYNRLGRRGLERHAAGGGAAASFTDAHDLFRRFFGGVGGDAPFGSSSSRSRRSGMNRTVRYQLEVTLEDLYKGFSRTVEVEAPMVDLWNRRPAPASAPSKRVDVHVPRGALDGEPIVVSGAMDFDKDEVPGDLVFIVHQRSHPTFVRKGHDLAVTVRIRFREAICGVTRTIRHLDGRKIVIGSARDTGSKHGPVLIETGDVQVLKGEGMPKDGQGLSFGDLYVIYEVIMPKAADHSRRWATAASAGGAGDFTPEDREELGRLLDKLEGVATNSVEASKAHDASTDDVVFLEKAALSDIGRASGQPSRRRDHHSSHDYGPESGHDFFGGAEQQFFFSSSAGSGNPFFGMHRQFGGFPYGAADDEGGENEQCRQM